MVLRAPDVREACRLYRAAPKQVNYELGPSAMAKMSRLIAIRFIAGFPSHIAQLAVTTLPSRQVGEGTMPCS